MPPCRRVAASARRPRRRVQRLKKKEVRVCGRGVADIFSYGRGWCMLSVCICMCGMVMGKILINYPIHSLLIIFLTQKFVYIPIFFLSIIYYLDLKMLFI